MDVLQHAAGVVGHLDAQQPPHAVVPRGREVGDGERALDQRPLELEAHHDVLRIAAFLQTGPAAPPVGALRVSGVVALEDA